MPIAQPRRPWIRLALMAALLAGCASPAMAPSAGIGVNVGGAQDIKLVRELVDRGQVPRDTQFTAQGLYAEHDLPIGEAPAGKPLHLSLGLGIAPALDTGKRTHWLQVGLGSGLAPGEFKRPPQHLVVVADRSGSMSGSRIVALRKALHALVDKLNDQDSLGVVIFDDRVDVVHHLSPLRDRATLHRAIDQIQDRGSTDIDAGLRAGYDMFLRTQAPAGYQRRVLLFTDALPNTGNTDPDGFESLVARYGRAGIGMTVFGIGLDFDAELTEVIGNQRGGNYVFLAEPSDVETVFNEDFDYLMSPAAYDMTLSITPAPGFKLTGAYGVSELKEGQTGYDLKVKSLFFSKNRGAIMLRMEETEPGAGGTGAPVVAKGTLKYLRADAKTEVTDTLEATVTGDRPTGDAEYYAPAATRKAVALTNQYLAMKEALRLYHTGDLTGAMAVLGKAKAQLEAARTALQAADLDIEISLVTKLSANIMTLASPRPSGFASVGPSPSPSASDMASPSPAVSPSASPSAGATR